jgi:hypothetical protein
MIKGVICFALHSAIEELHNKEMMALHTADASNTSFA